MAVIKKLVPRGLFGRSLLIIVVPLVLLQAVTALIFYERHWDTVSRRLALAGLLAGFLHELRRRRDGIGAGLVDKIVENAVNALALDVLGQDGNA